MDITVSELLQLTNLNIIDIRSKDEFLRGHIKGATQIDFSSLFFHPEHYLKKDQIYYLYCSSGSRSKRLVNQLNQKGYHTVNILGGYHYYLLRK